MSPFMKGQIRKTVPLLAVMSLLMVALLKISNGDVCFTLLTIYGCTSTPVIMLKAGFFLFVILLQYFQVDLILYYIEGMDYICIRYGGRKKVFGILFNRLMFLNILFVSLSLVGTGISLPVCGKNIRPFAVSEIVVIFVRGLGNCCLFSLIQVALLKYFDEAKCFGLMSLGALLLTFFNPFALFTVAEYSFIFQLAFWGIFYLVLCFLAAFIAKKIFIKEHTYGDRSI